MILTEQKRKSLENFQIKRFYLSFGFDQRGALKR